MTRCALVLIVAIVAASGVRAQPRGMTPEDQFALRDIGELQLAPDGATAAITMLTADLDANRVISRVALVEVANGRTSEVAAIPEGASVLRWSPDGRKLAFIAQQDEKGGVWAYDVGARTVTRVCDYDRGNGFLSKAGQLLAWSPDGTRLAFAGTLEPAPPTPDPLVVTRLQFKTRTGFSDDRRTHIYVVDAAGGRPRPLTRGHFDEHSIDWGGDGREIVFLSNREADPDANFNYDIFAVDVASGAVRRVTRSPGVELDPRLSPDGRSIAYVATTRPITTIDSVAEDTHVWVVPAAGGQPRELNHDLDRRSTSPAWTPDGTTILYLAADHGKMTIMRVPAGGGASEAVFDRPAQAGPFAAGPGGFVFAWTEPTMPRELYVHETGAPTPRLLTALNREPVARFAFTAPREIRYRSFDGTEIQAWLYPPLEPKRSNPLLLSIHGGPHGMYGYGFNAVFQAYAAQGYAVLAINPRGSSGYGQSFADGSIGNWGGGDYQDLMAGVDQVLRRRPDLDPQRLGVMGGSYGGFMTNWIITRTPRFKAAVSSASVSNLVSFYGTSLYQDLVHVEFDGFPWESDNFAQLWNWSPVAHVTHVSTPTLFLHGELDHDVPIEQAEEMYVALRRRGVETALVRYPREGHGFREPRHRLDAVRRTLDWFDRLLSVPE